MIDSKVLAFAGVALILTLTPGADTMLIIRNVLAYGRKDGFFIGQMRRLFSRPSVQRNPEAAAGVILIGLGLRLATERR